MEQSIPLIYARCDDGPAASSNTRIMGLLVGVCCLALMMVAATLKPSPDGLATHTELGLQRCAFLQNTGFPCPSCGMTTSFAWFARGNFVASAYIQPMGAMLALICCCCVWGGFYIALTGRPIHRLLRRVPSRYTVWPLISLAVAAWGWKIFLHLSGHDGW